MTERERSPGVFEKVGCDHMPRILIADDHPDLLAILSGRFRARGYDVQLANDGAEAVPLP